MRQKRSPAVWARIVLSLILALVLAGLIVAIAVLRPGTSLVLPASATLENFAEQPLVSTPIPEYPPGGTCLMVLPDGDLEFVKTCGCLTTPQPL